MKAYARLFLSCSWPCWKCYEQFWSCLFYFGAILLYFLFWEQNGCRPYPTKKCWVFSSNLNRFCRVLRGLHLYIFDESWNQLAQFSASSGTPRWVPTTRTESGIGCARLFTVLVRRLRSHSGFTKIYRNYSDIGGWEFGIVSEWHCLQVVRYPIVDYSSSIFFSFLFDFPMPYYR